MEGEDPKDAGFLELHPGVTRIIKGHEMYDQQSTWR
jgi:hypothetical protein